MDNVSVCSILLPSWYSWCIYLMAGVLASSLVTIFLLLRNERRKTRERDINDVRMRMTELEMKAVQAQMNPHFIFNAITSIQNYIYRNDIDKAISFLSFLSKIIRMTLDNASRKEITFQEEIEYLEAYLELEQMRFGDKYGTTLDIPDELKDSDLCVPPMMLQPIIENAIRHGLVQKTGPGHLNISFSYRNNRLSAIVEDDGNGRKPAAQTNTVNREGRKPHGLDLVRQRLDLLNQTYSDKPFRLLIEDLEYPPGEPSGTRVTLVMPGRPTVGGIYNGKSSN